MAFNFKLAALFLNASPTGGQMTPAPLKADSIIFHFCGQTLSIPDHKTNLP